MSNDKRKNFKGIKIAIKRIRTSFEKKKNWENKLKIWIEKKINLTNESNIKKNKDYVSNHEIENKLELKIKTLSLKYHQILSWGAKLKKQNQIHKRI